MQTLSRLLFRKDCPIKTFYSHFRRKISTLADVDVSTVTEQLPYDLLNTGYK